VAGGSFLSLLEYRRRRHAAALDNETAAHARNRSDADHRRRARRAWNQQSLPGIYPQASLTSRDTRSGAEIEETTSPHPFVTVNAVLLVSTAGSGSVTNDPDMPEGIANVASAPLDTNVVGVVSVWVILSP
jgi:hypothetical protein